MDDLGKRIFIFDKIRIFFKHTDYYGYVHPYNYFEWTSYVREAFFSENCGDFKKIIESKIKMMTAKIQLNAYDDCVFGDLIQAQLTVTKVKRVSFDVVVKFINMSINKVTAESRHTLVFLDSESNQFTNVPENIRAAIGNYQE